MDANTTRELPKIRKALDRIADALEAANKADPLTMLAQMAEEGAAMEPQAPFASNGEVHLYRHPIEGLHIVLRRDADEPGGYAITVEEA